MTADQNPLCAAPKEPHGIAMLTVKPRKLEEFKRLAAECMDKVRTKELSPARFAFEPRRADRRLSTGH